MISPSPAQRRRGGGRGGTPVSAAAQERRGWQRKRGAGPARLLVFPRRALEKKSGALRCRPSSPDRPEMVAALAPILVASQRISEQPCAGRAAGGDIEGRSGCGPSAGTACPGPRPSPSADWFPRAAVRQPPREGVMPTLGMRFCAVAVSGPLCGGHAATHAPAQPPTPKHRQRTCATSAAMALGPRSSPSTMPAAMASTFFSEPQISTPITSAGGWGGVGWLQHEGRGRQARAGG